MIRALHTQELAQRCNATHLGEDRIFSSVSTDSRTAQAGDLYVALRGDKHDGHDYVAQAMTRDCVACIVEQAQPQQDQHPATTQIVVKDSLVALAEVAAMNRDAFGGRVVAITGSAGKTTCKNMLHAILSQHAPTCVTAGNFNNEIGVPLTLMGLAEEHEFAVIEMGARRVGDIAYLGRFVRPHVAVLLNAGNAHLEVFGSYENIVDAKGEIYDALDAEGCAVVNLDDAAADKWLKRIGNRPSIGFSLKAGKGDVWADKIRYAANSTSFTLCHADMQQAVTINVPGKPGVVNALAASAAAVALGLSLQQLTRGLEAYVPEAGRLHTVTLAQGTRVIDDSYNANPASMRAALDILEMQTGKKIAVLGHMAELGEAAEVEHLALLEHIASLHIDSLLLIGPHAQAMASVYEGEVLVADDLEQLWGLLKPLLKGNEVVLVKGSRSVGLDRLVASMREELN